LGSSGVLYNKSSFVYSTYFSDPKPVPNPPYLN
jgi:hypothetical protein